MNTLFQKALIGTILLALLGQQVFFVTLHPVFAFKKKNLHHMFRHPSDAQKQNLTFNWNASAVEVSDPPPIHASTPPAPDLCVIITFPATTDPLKQQAHANTARVYESLQPRVRVFLSKPVPPEARNLNLPVLDAPSTNVHGTPLFASLVLLLEAACPDAPLLAYANSDILFDTSLLDTLDALLAWDQPEFMALGRRRNHDLQGQLTIHDVARVPNELFTDSGQDYFIFPRHLSANLSLLPSYVIGRKGYDNAINDWGFHQSILVDLTDTVIALHQTTSDGNYAGHSDKNSDKEYNVELPGAQFDHFSTLLGQYATVRQAGRVVVLRRSDGVVVSPSISLLQLTRRGQPITLDSLPAPLLVTFGNEAYRTILANFLCNTAVFPPMHAHTLIIVTDQSTVEYLSALDTDATIGLYTHPLQTGHEYDTPDYLRLMLLRGQILLTLLGTRPILWIEADAEYSGNLLAHPAIAAPTTDLVLYWDGTLFGGGFILFAATESARSFYASVMTRLESGISNGDYTNDQVILNDELSRQPHVTRTEFDRCQFRSGLIYHEEKGVDYRLQCQGTRPLVQQHNWIKGNQQKIDMAIQHGAWFLASDAPLPVCRQRDLRVIVMTMDRTASLERLLHSLRSAAYQPGTSVDLRVTVDRRPGQPHDAPTLSFLAQFDWPHGYFEVHAWPEPVGIYGQWVDSWPCEQFPSNLYKAAVLLEDDLEVSPVYHEWFIGAHQAYASPDLGAVTGMRAQLVAQIGVAQPIEQLIPKGLQVFAYRLIATWSMSPTHDAWRRFRAWVRTAKADPGYDPAVDGTHPGEWYRNFKASGNEAGMWEIWFLRFMHDQNLYTLYPWIEDGARTVVCNWREAGLHYDGKDSSSSDYPLVASLPSTLFLQALVPYVDWGLAFYHCLTSHLYGGTSNQILSIMWAWKAASKERKLLRLASINRQYDREFQFLSHWYDLFDESSIPFFLLDGVTDERCASFESYESAYLDMLNNKAEGLTLPMPRRELQETVMKHPRIHISVHGRSLEDTCSIAPLICPYKTDQSEVIDLCDYHLQRVSELFQIKNKDQVILFTDGQNQPMIDSYVHVDSRPFLEQLWAMVQSDLHIGNPKSSVDFLVYLWRKQLGRVNGIEPQACYNPWPVWMSNPEIQCISGTETVSCQLLASKEGPSLKDLALDEYNAVTKQTPSGWISAPVGPAFVYSNGDIIVCKDQKVFAGGGCSNTDEQASRDCPVNAPSTVQYMVVITQYWGEGYFHMVVEGLTRLAQAMHEHPAFFDKTRTIHVHSVSAQAEHFVRLMGLNHVISGDVLVTESLLSSPPTPCGGHRLSQHARWLRSFLLPSLPKQKLSQQPLLVLRTGARSIINHDALVDALGARVHTGNEPILEQLKMFAESELVVAPHGAGLANMVVMAKGANIVELQTAPANHCYLFLAINLDLNYFGYYESGAAHDGLWSVNISRLLLLDVFKRFKNSRQDDSVEVLNLHFVWVNPYLSPTTNNVKEEEALNVAKSWGVLPNSKMFFWTGQEIRNEFPDLVPVLEQIPVAAWISDIVRYNVVNKFGGLYLDTDELFLQDPRPLMKQNQNHFTVCQTPWLVPKTQTNEPCESVGCAVIAAPPGHPAVACAAHTSVQKSLAALEKQKGSTPVFDSAYSGPPMWTQCVKEHNMNIIPSWNFYPCPCCEDCKLTQYQDMEGIYGMHKWEHSWW
jgi:hypothetical protein